MRILLLCIGLGFFFESSAQIEFKLGPTVNTDEWAIITPVVEGKYAFNKPYGVAGESWGVNMELWYRQRWGIRFGTMWHGFLIGYSFDHPIVGKNGGGAVVVFANLYPLQLAYKHVVARFWKRNLYLQYGVGPIYCFNRGFDYAYYESGAVVGYPKQNMQIEFQNIVNGQFKKHFALLDGTLGLEFDLFKWLSFRFDVGYSKGFAKIGEYESYYQKQYTN